MSTQYTAGQYLIDRLKELGIGHVFGVPGDFGFPFLDQIEDDPDIAWAGNCNEVNAAYAADAYARLQGIAAVAGAAGIIDTLGASGVAGAYAEHVPLVLISFYPSAEERARRKPALISPRNRHPLRPRRRLGPVGRPLDGRGGPARDRDTRLPRRHAWRGPGPVLGEQVDDHRRLRDRVERRVLRLPVGAAEEGEVTPA
jgi:hypothetical protein